MSKNTEQGRTVLITGASSGIGREFCRIFASKGYNIIMVARNEQRMNELAQEIKSRHKIVVKILVKDLIMKESPQEIYDSLKAENIVIDVLVNNAGFGSYGKFHMSDPQWLYNMIEVNITALTKLSRLFLPDMIARGSGRIMNLASAAGFVPGPLSAVYYATKAYVLHFTEAIARELRGTGVTATAICPGPVPTEFFSHSNIEESRLGGIFPQAADKAARIGYRAGMKGKPFILTSWLYKIIIFSTRLAPRTMATWISYQMLSARKKK